MSELLWVCSSAAAILLALFVIGLVVAVLEDRARRREWASIHRFEKVTRSTGPRSLP